jgi:hypothetical protein
VKKEIQGKGISYNERVCSISGKTICQPIALRGLHWVQGQCRQPARVHVQADERVPEVESSGF